MVPLATASRRSGLNCTPRFCSDASAASGQRLTWRTARRSASHQVGVTRLGHRQLPVWGGQHVDRVGVGTLAESALGWVNRRMKVRTHTANVLVIGSGAAGLRAAIAAHQAGAEVVVVGKRRRLDAHTVLASGGINAALGTRDPEDSWQQHFADTLAEGYLLGDPRVVEDRRAGGAGAAVEELAEWGCGFARTDGRSHRSAVLRRPPLAAHVLRG